jgi:drug/metabolite transporter (DMT)-like permease
VPVPALLAVVVVFAGLAYPVTGAALDYTTPAMIATIRALAGGALLLGVLPLLRSSLPRGARLWGWAVVIGACNTTLTLMGIAEGTARAGAAIAAVLLNSSTLIAAALAWLLLRESLGPVAIAGLIVGFAGVVLVVAATPGSVGHGSDLAVGITLALVGALGWAVAGLLMRRLVQHEPDLDVTGHSALQFLAGGILLLPVLAASGGSTEWASASLWASLLFLVVLGHVAVYVAFNDALAQWAAARVYVWQFLVPVVAVTVEIARGRSPGGVVLGGMALAIAGVALVSLRR